MANKAMPILCFLTFQSLTVSGDLSCWGSGWSIPQYIEIYLFKSPGVLLPGVLFDGLLTGVLTQAATLLWIVDQFQRGLGKLIDIPRINQ